MHSDRLAERFLSLVASPERAASAVGDLLEEGSGRGLLWFWMSVARLVLSLLAHDLMVSPVRKVGACVLGWFLYMAVSLVVAMGLYVVVTVAWGVGYVLANHTGVELLANVLQVRLDWPPIPARATYAIQVAVFFAIAPFQIGRGSAPYWRGHELSLVVVLLLVWSAMATLVPFVVVGVRATSSMMPVVATFVLIGIISAQRTGETSSPR